MKLVSKLLSLILAGAALVFAGCTKKPMRPAPSDTNPVGQSGSGTNTLSHSPTFGTRAR